MTFHVLTLFPEVFVALDHSIIKRAVSSGKICINCINIRDYSQNKQKSTDDYPYGGGGGMVMMPEPVFLAYKSLNLPPNTPMVYLTPQGKVFDQKMAERFSREPEIALLCGHYEGIDQRIIDTFVTEEISLGDFVLTGGELAACAIIDAVSRLVSGVIKPKSLETESFKSNLLEYPQYTRPYDFLGQKVPDVLLSGNHGEIEEWRKKQAYAVTLKKRPDLLSKKDEV